MAGRDIEHRTEVRSGSRRGAVVLVAAVVVVGVAVVVLRDGEDASAPDDRRPPTTEAAAPGRVVDTPPVLAISDAGGGPVPVRASSDEITRFPPEGSTYEALQAPPVAVDGRVVVLADGGRLLVGEPGGTFEAVDTGGPVSELAASHEPDHVWVRTSPDLLALVDLAGGEPTSRIQVGDDRVLGPAGPGVVTMAGDGTLSWRRPGADPTPVPIPADRTAIDAGGELVLAEAPLVGDGVRRFETWSIDGGRLVQAFAVRASDRSGRLAPDGSVVALPERSGFVVHDATSGERISVLPLPGLPGTHPVWVGGDHFAVAPGAHLVVVSGSVRHRPRWPLAALAEASPRSIR